jgi:phosphoserine phosphatase RsbU/P
MRLLIAEDDVLFQKLLQQILAPDHEVIVARDGNEAWEKLRCPDAPALAILDWVMPGLSGPQVCRKVRACSTLSSKYLIILTTKNSEADIVAGLRSGADDYITKPPVPAELRARVRVGERILALQQSVEAQSMLANQASGRENLLRGLIANCPSGVNVPGQAQSCAIGPCSRQHCAPGDCCSLSGTETGSLMHRCADVSLEKYHSQR